MIKKMKDITDEHIVNAILRFKNDFNVLEREETLQLTTTQLLKYNKYIKHRRVLIKIFDEEPSVIIKKIFGSGGYQEINIVLDKHPEFIKRVDKLVKKTKLEILVGANHG